MTRLLARNLYHLMRGAARRTSVEGLKKKGHRTVSVLNFKDVHELIGRAIENTLQRRGLSLDGSDLQDEVRHEFLSLMRERDALQNTVDALLREKDELKRNQGQLRDELGRATAEYQNAQEFSLETDTGDLKVLMDKLQTSLRRTLSESGTDTEVSDRALALVHQAIQEHQSLLTERAKTEQASHLIDLQRRIAKLKRKLEETEDMLARARTTGVQDGIEGEMVEAGVRGDDPNSAMKKELLSEIFRLNVELRQMLKTN